MSCGSVVIPSYWLRGEAGKGLEMWRAEAKMSGKVDRSSDGLL